MKQIKLWQDAFSPGFNSRLHDGPSILTLGNFDGVHSGHRKLIGSAVKSATDKRIPSILVTFEPHPQKMLSSGTYMGAMMTLPQKLGILEGLGIECVWAIPFSREFSELEPGVFLGALGKCLSPVELHVGQAFRFGQGRAGDIGILQGWGKTIGCKVAAHAYKAPDGGTLSSSRIRQALAGGDIGLASELLGAPFKLTGFVVEGDRRGRSLGYPTANLKQEQGFSIGHGVYVSAVQCQPHFCEPALGLTNVGMKPTFGGGQLAIETYLPGMDIDLYGSRIEVDFLHRLRGEEKFENIEALKAKIAGDVEAGISWWKTNAR